MVQDLHQFFQETVTRARESPLTPPETPLAVVAGSVTMNSGFETVRVPDESCILCEPRNPVLVKMADMLQTIITRFPNFSAYTFDGFCGKLLRRYTLVGSYGRLARSVIRLNGNINGTLDACGRCITVHDLFAQAPTCMPSPHLQWFVLDRERISETLNYQWFLNITEDAILHSTMWITLIFQYALGMTTQLDSFAACSGGGGRLAISVEPLNNPLRVPWLQSWPQAKK